MFRHLVIRSLMILALSCVIPRFAMAQQFDRTSYEVGVLYDDDVYRATTPCTLDDFRNYVGWGDNEAEGLISISHPPFPTPQGTVVIYRVSRHVYDKPGAYAALATTLVHCSGSFDHNYKDVNVTLTAYPRGSVGGLTVGAGPFKLGQEVTLTVFSPNKALALASGTRVYLTGKGNIDPKYPLAAYVDIPAGQYQVTTTFRLGTVDTAKSGGSASSNIVTITGKANNTQQVRFKIGS